MGVASDVVRTVGNVPVIISGSLAQDVNVPGIQATTEMAVQMAVGVTKLLEKIYGEVVEPEIRKVIKTNEEKVGITFKPKTGDKAPTIYPEDYSREWVNGNHEQVLKSQAKLIHESISKKLKLPELTPEEARKHITLNLVNTEMNPELLSRTPHMEILGGELSAIPRWRIDEQSSFIVNNELTSRMGLTPEEVMQMGQKNIDQQQFSIRPMQEVLQDMMGGDPIGVMQSPDEPQIMVVTNSQNFQGSNALLSDATLQEVHQKIGGDYAVLPSSIHEVLCVPITEKMRPDDLRAMVKEVNVGVVDATERLSDEIFKFNGETLSLVGDTFKMEQPKVESQKVESDGIKFAM